MAENRKSFILHIDSLDIIDELTDEQAGQLFRAIKAYQKNEQIELNQIVKIAFSQFRNQFVRDEEKYKQKSEQAAKAGSIGGKRTQAKSSERLKNEANQADSDSDSKSDLIIYADFIKQFNEIRGSNFRGGDKEKRQLNARLKDGYTIQDIIEATKMAVKEPYHIETNFKHITPEFMTRADKLAKFLQMTKDSQAQYEEPPKPTKPDMTGWSEHQIYVWRIDNEKDFGYMYWVAHDSQYNTVEKEKRGIFKDYYDQQTLKFKSRNGE